MDIMKNDTSNLSNPPNLTDNYRCTLNSFDISTMANSRLTVKWIMLYKGELLKYENSTAIGVTNKWQCIQNTQERERIFGYFHKKYPPKGTLFAFQPKSVINKNTFHGAWSTTVKNLPKNQQYLFILNNDFETIYKKLSSFFKRVTINKTPIENELQTKIKEFLKILKDSQIGNRGSNHQIFSDPPYTLGFYYDFLDGIINGNIYYDTAWRRVDNGSYAIPPDTDTPKKNSNSNAQDAVGIEIEIIKKNNITIIESNSNKRF
jgi:hypothetical protein